MAPLKTSGYMLRTCDVKVQALRCGDTQHGRSPADFAKRNGFEPGSKVNMLKYSEFFGDRLEDKLGKSDNAGI